MFCPKCGKAYTEFIMVVCSGYWELWKCLECRNTKFYVLIK